jgi:hypothetical protein
MSRIGLAGALAPIAIAYAGVAPAFAADEEIQVYMDEIGQVRKLSLDVHVNHALVGRNFASFPGEQISDNRTRITPEFGYALDGSWELGAYLPLANIDKDGDVSIDGVKLRLKYIAPHEDTGWFWGANLEIGYVNDTLDQNPWNGELKGILGYRSGPWTFAGNANFGFKVSGDYKAPVDFGIATKVSYAMSDTLSVGIENYNSFGELKHPTTFDRNDQQVYAVVDKTFGSWDLNFGVGWGYGEPEDNFIVKAIIGVPLG